MLWNSATIIRIRAYELRPSCVTPAYPAFLVLGLLAQTRVQEELVQHVVERLEELVGLNVLLHDVLGAVQVLVFLAADLDDARVELLLALQLQRRHVRALVRPASADAYLI